jgi:hypothetical protein
LKVSIIPEAIKAALISASELFMHTGNFVSGAGGVPGPLCHLAKAAMMASLDHIITATITKRIIDSNHFTLPFNTLSAP